MVGEVPASDGCKDPVVDRDSESTIQPPNPKGGNMYRRTWMTLIGVLIILSFVLGACGAPAPTAAPAAPAKAEPTKAPAAAPTKAPEPTKAPDASQGCRADQGPPRRRRPPASTPKRPCWPTWSRPASCRPSISALARSAGRQSHRGGRQVRRHLAPRLERPGRLPCLWPPELRADPALAAQPQGSRSSPAWPRSGNSAPTARPSPSPSARVSSGPTASPGPWTTSSSGGKTSRSTKT